jgi:hypothetical protein
MGSRMGSSFHHRSGCTSVDVLPVSVTQRKSIVSVTEIWPVFQSLDECAHSSCRLRCHVQPYGQRSAHGVGRGLIECATLLFSHRRAGSTGFRNRRTILLRATALRWWHIVFHERTRSGRVHSGGRQASAHLTYHRCVKRLSLPSAVARKSIQATGDRHEQADRIGCCIGRDKRGCVRHGD